MSLSPRQRTILRRLAQRALSPWEPGFGWGTYKALVARGLVQGGAKSDELARLTKEGREAVASNFPAVMRQAPKLRKARPITITRTDADTLRDIAKGLHRGGLVNFAAELERIADAAEEVDAQGREP